MEDPQSLFKCCEVKTMCGQSLRHGVIFVGISTLVISFISFLLSVLSAIRMTCGEEKKYNEHPFLAINLVFSLVTCTLSFYQIVISTLLLWQALKIKSNIFLLSLWYVSHLSILLIYFVLFTVQLVMCLVKKKYILAVLTFLFFVVYEGTFIYYNIVVNSYLHSLHHERYF